VREASDGHKDTNVLIVASQYSGESSVVLV